MPAASRVKSRPLLSAPTQVGLPLTAPVQLSRAPPPLSPAQGSVALVPRRLHVSYLFTMPPRGLRDRLPSSSRQPLQAPCRLTSRRERPIADSCSSLPLSRAGPATGSPPPKATAKSAATAAGPPPPATPPPAPRRRSPESPCAPTPRTYLALRRSPLTPSARRLSGSRAGAPLPPPPSGGQPPPHFLRSYPPSPPAAQAAAATTGHVTHGRCPPQALPPSPTLGRRRGHITNPAGAPSTSREQPPQI
jgi:hypothetical protein